MTQTGNHWPRHAQQWDLVGPPLRPSPADIATFERWLVKAQAQDVLLLGMTPELARIAHPARLFAVDAAKTVIARLWPSDPPPGRAAFCGDWRNLPLQPASFDAVIGDGALNMMQGLAALAAFAAEARRVLRPGGILLLRIFSRPDMAETPQAVLAALRGGRIGSFHAFKWRFAMSLHGSLDQGVCLADIWQAWDEAVADPRALLAELGWDEKLAGTIEIYRGQTVRYCFPQRAEIGAIFGRFEEIEYAVQHYELAERCPIIALRGCA